MIDIYDTDFLLWAMWAFKGSFQKSTILKKKGGGHFATSSFSQIYFYWEGDETPTPTEKFDLNKIISIIQKQSGINRKQISMILKQSGINRKQIIVNIHNS